MTIRLLLHANIIGYIGDLFSILDVTFMFEDIWGKDSLHFGEVLTFWSNLIRSHIPCSTKQSMSFLFPTWYCRRFWSFRGKISHQLCLLLFFFFSNYEVFRCRLCVPGSQSVRAVPAGCFLHRAVYRHVFSAPRAQPQMCIPADKASIFTVLYLMCSAGNIS